MLTTVRYIFLTAIRDWLFIGLAAAILIAIGVSFFLGSVSLVEQSQMSLVYTAGSTRVILLIGLIVFVCFHVRRAFDHREVEVILTRPISRPVFVFSYWLGFALLPVIVVFLLSFVMLVFMQLDFMGLMFWSTSLILESFVIVAFALACSLILNSAVSSVLVSFGFYLISRMMGFFTAIIDKPVVDREISWAWIMENVLTASSVVLPRMDLFAKSKWLVYGIASDVDLWFAEIWPIFLVQSLVYVPLLLLMGIYDFRRRQF